MSNNITDLFSREESAEVKIPTPNFLYRIHLKNDEIVDFIGFAYINSLYVAICREDKYGQNVVHWMAPFEQIARLEIVESIPLEVN